MRDALHKLFEPGFIGKLRLKNRIIMAPISTNLAATDGAVTEELIFHYAERARGGVGLVTVENVCVDYPVGRYGAAQPRIDEERFIPGLHGLTDAVHEAGALIAVELSHPGASGEPRFSEGRTPVAPSAVPRVKDGLIPLPLAREEARAIVARYVEAAERACKAGFDAVELQACHGLLINQFLSPYTNKRQDEYGGDPGNRLRFLLEILEGIKRNCGSDFPVMVRLVAQDLVEGGICLEDAAWFARQLQEAGADSIQPDFGLGKQEKRLEPMPYRQAWRVYLAEAMKQAVHLPVIAVGVIREPNVAEQVLESGRADFVALGRALIADPEWPKKALSGAEGSIRKCISCNECVMARHVEDAPLRCTLNPAVGKGPAISQIGRAQVRRKVVVVGGGPAGMEAARVAALRGHDVALYEKENRLGGALNMAAVPPGKEKLNWVTEYYNHELPRLGVALHLGVMVDEATVRASQAEVVILATGSEPATLAVPGADGPNVSTAQAVLAGRVTCSGEHIAVIGGGMLGLETAEYLAAQGNVVTVLKRYKGIARSIEPLYCGYLLRSLAELGVEIVTEVEVSEITGSGVVVVDSRGESRLIGAERVVIARDPKPAQELAQSLEDLRPIVIGDACQPRKIINAIHEGNAAARAICSRLSNTIAH